MELIGSRMPTFSACRNFFIRWTQPGTRTSTISANKFNYHYTIISHDNDGDKHFIGNVIFSRYPIIDSGMIRYLGPLCLNR